jgi:hypothetical protein
MSKLKKLAIKAKQKKDSKVPMTLILTIVGLLLAAIGIFGFPYLKSLIWPINVEPSEIAVQQSPWSTKAFFNVSNLRTDKTHYDVWIMLKFVNCTFTPQNISIELPDLKDTLTGRVGQIEANYDCVVLQGFDEQDNMVAFLIIHHLLPNQSLPITININASEETSISKNAKIYIKSIHQSDTPVNLNSNGSALSYPFTPPISFTVKSISYKLRKIE